MLEQRVFANEPTRYVFRFSKKEIHAEKEEKE